MRDAVERIYEATMNMVANRGLTYPDKGAIQKCVDIAISVENAVIGRRDEIEQLDDPDHPRGPPPAPVPLPDLGTLDDRAMRMFNAYNAAGQLPNRTFDGREVPPWTNLTVDVREKWCAAAALSLPEGKQLPRTKVLEPAPEAKAAAPSLVRADREPIPGQPVSDPAPTAPAK